jgi:ADP-ribose pyrophosphatase YjhB (NUDIX family)/predicted GNAT family acetyltransferase
MSDIAKRAKAKLEKGAARRLKGAFDPMKELPPDDAKNMASWVGGNGDKRENLPEMSPAARHRATNKLMSRTKWRKNPETSEREFLLHRQMSIKEHDKSISGGKITHGKTTSWTPDPARVEEGIYKPGDAASARDYGRRVSAWIPESKIKSYIPQYGAHATADTKAKQPVERRGAPDMSEQEVIVHPHTSDIHETHADLRADKYNTEEQHALEAKTMDGKAPDMEGGWKWTKTYSTPDMKKSELAKSPTKQPSKDPILSANYTPKAPSESYKQKAKQYIEARAAAKKPALDKGERGDWKKEGYKISHTPAKSGITVHAHDKNGNLVGETDFVHRGDAIYPDHTEVDEGHQRKGIATGMYHHAMSVTGKKIQRPGYHDQTPDARAFWDENSNRQFGKSELAKAITNKKVANHWHQSAYPYEDYSKENREHFEDMLANHHEGQWTKTKIPVAQTEGHHSGHDKTGEYIKEYADQRNTGSEFPAIIAKPHPDKPGHFKTIDGMHRLAAAKAVGQTHIDAYIPKADKLDKGEKGDWKSEGYTLSHEHYKDEHDGHNKVVVRAHTKTGKLAGEAHVHNDEQNHILPHITEVKAAHRRKGLASAMYQHAEHVTGKRVIRPEHDSQSASAKKLWDRPNKPFGKSEELGKSWQPKFDPADIPKEHRVTASRWTQSGSDLQYTEADRQNIPEMQGAMRARGLQRLHAATQTRRNPETGEREFLLHRGMHEDEFNTYSKDGHIDYSGKISSWTPKEKIAQNFGSEANWPTKGDEYKPENKHVSIWAPESAIHHVPKMLGSMDDKTDARGKMERHGEFETLLKPGKYKTHAVAALAPMEDRWAKFSPRPVAKSEDLDKGIKEAATAIALGASALAPTHLSNAMTAPQKPAMQAPARIALHPDLEHISFIESSGGKNKNHEKTTVGVNAGHTAGGATGLMPITIQETLKKNPALGKKYAHLVGASHDTVTSEINKNPDMEADIANAHWNRLGNTLGHDKAKMAFAWRNGITAAKRATPEELSGHPYVQKFMKRSAQRKVAGLEKGERGDWKKEGYSFEHHSGEIGGTKKHSIIAKDKAGKSVGEYHFNEHSDYVQPSMVKTLRSHKRKGLATQAYKMAEQKSGKAVKPGWSMTNEAKALWSQESRPFGKNEPLDKTMSFGHSPSGGALTGGAALVAESIDGASRLKEAAGKIKKKLEKADDGFAHKGYQFKSVAHPKTPKDAKAFELTHPSGEKEIVFAKDHNEMGAHIDSLEAKKITKSAKDFVGRVNLAKAIEELDEMEELAKGSRYSEHEDKADGYIEKAAHHHRQAELHASHATLCALHKDLRGQNCELALRCLKKIHGKDAAKVLAEKLDKAGLPLGKSELAKAAKDDVSEVASVAVRNGHKILMGARRDNERWTLPGGHLNAGEEKEEGAARELFEESGIKADPKDLKYLGSEDVTTFTGKKKRIHSYSYEHQGEIPTVENDPDKEVHQWHWIDAKDGLPSHIAENLHSPKNSTLQRLGLQDAEMAKSDVASRLKKAIQRNSLEKGINGDWKDDPKYRFKHTHFKSGGNVIRAYHGRTKVGHFAYSESPDKEGYHFVHNGDVSSEHQGKGLYQEMMRRAGEHVVGAGAKGLKSEGYQRSKDATRVWDKVATHAMPYTSNAKVSGEHTQRTTDYYYTPELKKSEPLEKMSRPAIGFPNFKKLSTRPDQEVQTVESNRQAEMFGRKAAVANDMSTVTRADKYKAIYGRDIPKPTAKDTKSPRDQAATMITNSFGRNTLGMVVPSNRGPKAAALTGKLRSKFEDGGDEYNTKLKEHTEKRNAIVRDHNEKVAAWRTKAYDLSTKSGPGAKEAYDAHVATRPAKPKLPRKPSKPKVETKALAPDKQKARGQSIDSTIHHEGLHHSMAEMEKHYGKRAAHNATQGMLSQFHPDAIRHVASFISNRMGYKTSSPKFPEEVLTHSRDILVNPDKRKKFKEHVGTDKADETIKQLKVGHEKAYRYAQTLRPEDVGAGNVKKSDVASRLKKAIDRNSDITLELSLVDDEASELEKAEFAPTYEGEIHPTKGYIAAKHPTLKTLMWTSAPETQAAHDRHIGRDDLKNKLLSRVEHPEHKKILTSLIGSVQKDPRRHFIPTEESGRHVLRARHLKSLMHGSDDISMDTSDPSRLRITLHQRHGRNTAPTSFLYTMKKG